MEEFNLGGSDIEHVAVCRERELKLSFKCLLKGNASKINGDVETRSVAFGQCLSSFKHVFTITTSTIC